MTRFSTALQIVHALLWISGALPPAICADDIINKAGKHWAFQPRQWTVPDVSGDRIESPIDAFVETKLRERGLTFSPRADRATLIRRAHAIVHGLLPTEEVQQGYLEDARPDWYQRLVDELLASPRFGERFGRHWLDLARYAESNGFETNRPRPNAYHYRDYIIESFNLDTPYDRFILEQIAGDSLGRDVATGFLVAGPHDVVKGAGKELQLMQRSDQLADFVNTVTTAFLGLTVACSRCHDHKFDPVSQKDYYAMEAIFAGVQPGERRQALSTNEQVQRRKIAQQRAELESQLRKSRLRKRVSSVQNVEHIDPIVAKSVRFTILEATEAEPCIDELEIWSTQESTGGEQNVALASGGALARASGSFDMALEIHRLEHINDGRHGNSHSWISNEIGRGWVEIELAHPVPIHRIEWSRDQNGVYSDRLAKRYRIDVTTPNGTRVMVASSSDRAPAALPLEPSDNLVDRLTSVESESVAAIVREWEVLRDEEAKIPGHGFPVWAGTFVQPGPTHVLFRGDPLDPREVVGPDVASFFGALDLDPKAPEHDRRLALAKWLGRPDNPLVARVYVNRLWQYLFGVGLVSTPSDFGTNGLLPSHAELLDFLADELVRSGWSTKHVVRTIVLSRAFQQACTPNLRAQGIDQGNRLLWRFAPRRLEAEVIRDTMLQVTGCLDLRMGGPGFVMVVAREANVYNYESKTSFGPGDWRRMVYAHVIRGERDATFGAFDRPDGGLVAPKRSRSTTSLQALNLLNSPFVVQQTENFAQRIRSDAGTDPVAQARRAFELVFRREPAADELSGAEALVTNHGLLALCRALLNASEFLFVY